MNILVVDDAKDSRLILKTALERQGHYVTTSVNGEEAWSLFITDKTFEVVISDWLMPELDGPGLCSRIRATPLSTYTYLILLTGLTGKANIINGIAAGADDFSTKPINVEELEVRLRSAKRILDLEKSLALQNEALKRANEKLQSMATTDALTGLFNRRAFQKSLEETLLYSRRGDEAFSLLMIDVDFFKSFNDTYGHLKGDLALKTVADILKNTSRHTDYVARFGGEEFTVLLPKTGRKGAMLCAEELRKAIEHNQWPDRPVTISIGVTTVEYQTTKDGLPANIPSKIFTKVLNEADQALYQAKEVGRNTVCHFVDELECSKSKLTSEQPAVS